MALFWLGFVFGLLIGIGAGFELACVSVKWQWVLPERCAHCVKEESNGNSR